MWQAVWLPCRHAVQTDGHTHIDKQSTKKLQEVRTQEGCDPHPGLDSDSFLRPPPAPTKHTTSPMSGFVGPPCTYLSVSWKLRNNISGPDVVDIVNSNKTCCTRMARRASMPRSLATEAKAPGLDATPLLHTDCLSPCCPANKMANDNEQNKI